MSDYQSTISDAFRPIEKKPVENKVFPADISKLIRQSNKMYIRDTGIRYLDPDTKIVYVYYKYKGTIEKEDISAEDRETFFGNSFWQNIF